MDCQGSQMVFIMETSDCEDEPSNRMDDDDDPLAVPVVKSEAETEMCRNNTSNCAFPEDGGLRVVKREAVKSEILDTTSEESSMNVRTVVECQQDENNLFQEMPENSSEFLQVSDQNESLINSHPEEMAVLENQNDPSLDLNGLTDNVNETQIKLVEFHSCSGSRSSYLCTVCNETFENVKLLTKHLVQHSANVKPFQCPLCVKTVTTRQSLFNHLCIHTGWRPYTCDFCGKKFISKYNSVVHIRDHEYSRNISCTVCNEKFESTEMFKAHSSFCPSKQISCAVCNRQFDYIDMFKAHFPNCSSFGAAAMGINMSDTGITNTTDSNITNRAESNATNNTDSNIPQVTGDVDKDSITNCACTICNEVIGDLSELNKHLVSHSSSSPPYPCPICKRLFRRKYYLYNHIGLHCGNRCYSCPECGKGFKDLNSLNRHSRAKHTTHSESANVNTGDVYLNVPPISQDSALIYFCNMCNKYYPSSSIFENHKCDHLEQQAFSDMTAHTALLNYQTGTSQLQPLSNGTVVHTVTNNNEISVMAEKQTQGVVSAITTEMTVPSTGVYFDATVSALTPQISLVTHGSQIGESGIIHAPEETCEEEDSSFFCKIVDVYSEAVTESEMPENTVVEKETNTQQQAVEEAAQQESLITPLFCPVCNVEFKDVFGLTEHIVLHVSNRSPFSCPICQKLVMHRHNVYRHVCLHTGYRPYLCSFCSRSFIQKRYLDRHLLLAHGQPASDELVSPLFNESQPQVQGGEMASENLTSIEETATGNSLSSVRRNEVRVESDDEIISDLDEDTIPEIIEIGRVENSSKSNQVEDPATSNVEIIEIEEEKTDGQEQIAESSDHEKSDLDTSIGPEIENVQIIEPPCSPEGNNEERRESSVLMSLDLEVTVEPENMEIENSTSDVSQISQQIPLSCSICEAVFKDSSFLNAHLLCHSSAITPFNCPLCKMSYGLRSELENHLFLHTGIRSLGCHICGKSFVTTRSLLDHHREHAGLHSHDDESNNHGQQDECTESGIVDSFQKSLNQSSSILRRVLIDGARVPVLVDSWSGFQTEQTDESNSNKETKEKQCFTIIDVGLNVLPQILCNICGGMFENKSLITKHLVEHSSTISPHPCPACNKKFKSKFILEWHLSIHTGYEFPFSCRICKASFAQKELLRLHIEYNHKTCLVTNEDEDEFMEELPEEQQSNSSQNISKPEVVDCGMTIGYNEQEEQIPNSEILASTIKCEIQSNDTMQIETIQEQREELLPSAVEEMSNKDENNLVLCAAANYQTEIFPNQESNLILIQPQILNNVFAIEPTGIGTLVSSRIPNELAQESGGIISENMVANVTISDFSNKEKKINYMNINSSTLKHKTSKQIFTNPSQERSLCREKCLKTVELFETIGIKVEQMVENGDSAEQPMDCGESLGLVSDKMKAKAVEDSNINISHKCPACGKLFREKKLLWKHIRIQDRHAFSCNKLNRLRRKQIFQEKKDWNLSEEAQGESDTKLNGEEENYRFQDSPNSQEEECEEFHESMRLESDNEVICSKLSDDLIEKSSGGQCNLFSIGKSNDSNHFQCKICSKDFSDSGMLVKHLATHADGLNCPVCNRKFHFKASLTRHLSIHTGFCYFRCVLCDRFFTGKQKLGEHIYTHKFSCQMCLIPFKEATELTSHLETKHEMCEDEYGRG